MKEPAVGLMTEWLRGNELEIRAAEVDSGGTMRLGAIRADLMPGSRIAAIYGATSISERHRHRFEVNTAYRERLAQKRSRLRRHVAGRPVAGDDRISRSPVFIGVQFHPDEFVAFRATSAVREFYCCRGRAIAAGGLVMGKVEFPHCANS